MKVVKKRCKCAVWTCICIFFGNAIIAFAIAAFVMPHGLIMGGATGLSILINRVLRSDIAVVVLSLNLLALLLGYVVLGKKFLITTVGSSLLYPALLGLAQRIPGITALTDDLLLASLLAGGLIGIAVGMVMRVGGSTGGTDVLNLVLHKWFHLPVSAFVYLVDIMILGGQAIFSDPEQVLYGVVLLVTETIALDKIMLMGQSQVQLFVISDHFEEIRQKLLLKLHAGVTMMLIETGCTGTQQKGVLCVIPPRKLFAAKELIQSIDPDAFITVTQIKEVRGQGFTLERKDYFPPCQRDE